MFVCVFRCLHAPSILIGQRDRWETRQVVFSVSSPSSFSAGKQSHRQHDGLKQSRGFRLWTSGGELGVLLLAVAFRGQKNQSEKCPADNIRLEQVPNGSHQGSCVIVPSSRNVSVREIITRFHKLLLQFF